MMCKKTNCRAARKGISISEMCVVLAVVSIVALTVVSFTTMVSAQSRASAARLNAMEDVALIQTVIENWVEQMEPKATIKAEGEKLSAVVDGKTYTVSLADNDLAFQYLQAEPMAFALKSTSQLQFETMKNSGGTIYFCSVTYQIPHPTKGDVAQTAAFCIDPRVGEVIK